MIEGAIVIITRKRACRHGRRRYFHDDFGGDHFIGMILMLVVEPAIVVMVISQGAAGTDGDEEKNQG